VNKWSHDYVVTVINSGDTDLVIEFYIDYKNGQEDRNPRKSSLKGRWCVLRNGLVPQNMVWHG